VDDLFTDDFLHFSADFDYMIFTVSKENQLDSHAPASCMAARAASDGVIPSSKASA
jgi:hypothetical protein